MEAIKNVALVAHDNRKKDLAEWVEWNYQVLLEHNLICTGTRRLERKNRKRFFTIFFCILNQCYSGYISDTHAMLKLEKCFYRLI